MSKQEKWEELLKNLNAIESVYKLEGIHSVDPKIIRYNAKKTDFVQIYEYSIGYLAIRTNFADFYFRGRGTFDTKNIAKKLHKHCNRLIFKLATKNDYSI